MTSPIPTDPFERWLLDSHYRPSTLRQTVWQVKRARKEFGATGELPASFLEGLRRYAAYATSLPEGSRSDFDQRVVQEIKPAREKRAPKEGRKRPATSFTPSEWESLYGALAMADEPESKVIYVQFITGYRIGDVLRLERKKLAAAMKSGILQVEIKGGHVSELPIEGARDVWEMVLAAWPGSAATMDKWVCPDGSMGAEAGYGAYQCVNRYFKKLGEELGLDSRLHLHRIRRTVGTRAIKATRDIHLVKQLLGHKSIASTEIYLDELRTEEVADLQKRLRSEGTKSP